MGTLHYAVSADKTRAVALGKNGHSEVANTKFESKDDLKAALLSGMGYRYNAEGWSGDVEGHAKWVKEVVAHFWSLGSPFEVVNEHASGVPYEHTTIVASVFSDDGCVGDQLGWQMDTSCMGRT